MGIFYLKILDIQKPNQDWFIDKNNSMITVRYFAQKLALKALERIKFSEDRQIWVNMGKKIKFDKRYLKIFSKFCNAKIEIIVIEKAEITEKIFRPPIFHTKVGKMQKILLGNISPHTKVEKYNN
jgi:glucan biosynthesis protein